MTHVVVPANQEMKPVFDAQLTRYFICLFVCFVCSVRVLVVRFLALASLKLSFTLAVMFLASISVRIQLYGIHWSLGVGPLGPPKREVLCKRCERERSRVGEVRAEFSWSLLSLSLSLLVLARLSCIVLCCVLLLLVVSACLVWYCLVSSRLVSFLCRLSCLVSFRFSFRSSCLVSFRF